MSTITTFAAIVSGFPARLKQPKPLPDETIVHFVIRNDPEGWRNFVGGLEYNFDIPKKVRQRLISGRFSNSDLGSLGPKVEGLLEEFTNDRLPYHARTLKCLATLQRRLNNPMYGFSLNVVLYPRERKLYDPDEERTVEQFVSKFGVNVLWTKPNDPRNNDLAIFLPLVHSDFLWQVPGGTRFTTGLVIENLRRVFRYFAVSSERAFYTDNADSVIYRTTALHELARRGKDLSANSREMARMLQEAGYECVVDNDPHSILCELETEYGGRGISG